MKELTEVRTIQATYIYKGDSVDEIMTDRHVDLIRQNLAVTFNAADDVQINVQQFLFEKPDEPTFPERGRPFYYIDNFGQIKDGIWLGSETDKTMRRNGNCFRTRKEAKVALISIQRLLFNLRKMSENDYG